MVKKYMLLAVIVVLAGYISCGGNTAPLISDITFGPAAPYAGDTVTCAVIAADAEDDTLTFTWSATVGSLSATAGDTVTWTYDVAGVYTITVEASDGELADTFSKDVTLQSTQVYGENTNADSTHSLVWLYRDIVISGAPANAQLDSVFVVASLSHPYPSDYRPIRLKAPDGDSVDLWFGDYSPSTGDTTKVALDFAGDSPNGTWTLGVYDWTPGDDGMFHKWSIDIYW